MYSFVQFCMHRLFIDYRIYSRIRQGFFGGKKDPKSPPSYTTDTVWKKKKRSTFCTSPLGLVDIYLKDSQLVVSTRATKGDM